LTSDSDLVNTALNDGSLGHYTPLASDEISGIESHLPRQLSTDSDEQDSNRASQIIPCLSDVSTFEALVEQQGALEDEQICPEKRSSLTFLNGLALVIGLQIGSGIFSSPSQVSLHVPSPGVGILVWFVGGLLVWTGAASFIELGLAIPRNGGIQEYLRACYGDFMGFLFTWIWVAISKPSAVAMIAMVFSDHLCRTFLSAQQTSVLMTKAVALLGIAFITFINCLGAKTGALVANGFLFLKLFAVFSIAFLGIAVMIRGTGGGVGPGKPGWFAERTGLGHQSAWLRIGEYVTALYGALFCYGGWETVSTAFSVQIDSRISLIMRNKQIGFVAGDMKDPVRDLPRVINTAMTTVITGFVLMNTALYVCVPMKTLRENSTVAVVKSLQIFKEFLSIEPLS
jgi:L-type amino acid transporter 6